MDAPKPINYSFIKKEITSEEGQKYSLRISYTNNKFEFIAEKNGKLFKDKFRSEISLSQIQSENKYFKIFDTPEELLEELNQKINLKVPILKESENNSLNLFIFLQNSKFNQAEFRLTKENFELNKNPEDFKSALEKLYDSVEELKKENKELKLQNQEFKKRLDEFEGKLVSNKQKDNKERDFHWINSAVNIVDNSTFLDSHTPDIMLGKKYGDHSLTKGNRNHYIEFSFNYIYFLKAIRISVANYECTLKNFTVEIIPPNGDRYELGKFIRSKYGDNTGFEEFPINKECKGIKLYLIDNWGSGGGDYILIKRIDFNVSV